MSGKSILWLGILGGAGYLGWKNKDKITEFLHNSNILPDESQEAEEEQAAEASSEESEDTSHADQASFANISSTSSATPFPSNAFGITTSYDQPKSTTPVADKKAQVVHKITQLIPKLAAKKAATQKLKAKPKPKQKPKPKAKVKPKPKPHSNVKPKPKPKPKKVVKKKTHSVGDLPEMALFI